MRATTILSTLALTAAVIAAPAPRPVQAGISDANPMDPEGNLAIRASVGVDVDPKKAEQEMTTSLAALKKLEHGASAKVPAKVSVSGRQVNEVTELADELSKALPLDTLEGTVPLRERQLGLPTTEVTGVVGEVEKALPLAAVEEALPLSTVEGALPAIPIRKRQLGLPTTEVTGVVGEVEKALPLSAVEEALPLSTVEGALPAIPIRRRQLGLPTSEVTGVVGEVEEALPLSAVEGALPAIPIRRGEVSSLMAPVTSTLTLLVTKFSAVTQGLSSATTKLNAMLPANIDNADAMFTEVTSTLATIKPQFFSAINDLKAGDVQSVLSNVSAAKANAVVVQLTSLMTAGEQMLTQMSKDADAIAGLGLTKYVTQIKSIQTDSTTMLSQLKTASVTITL